MIGVSISELVNEIDKNHFTLYTEWQDTHFKITILRSCMIPLSGEMYMENANYFLDYLDESLNVYLEKTRQAFSGEDMEIQFFLQDNIFMWKQQNILTRGKITVYPLSNIISVSNILKQSLEYYQKCQKQIATLERENESLSQTNAKLATDINNMVNMKNIMEKDLYRKFLLLLNTKKKKIRELQETLDSNKHAIKSKYTETTDESEESEIESKDVYDINIKSDNVKKCKTDCKSECETISTKSRTIFKRCASPEPSTSTGKVILENMHVYGRVESRSFLDITEEESEDDLFS